MKVKCTVELDVNEEAWAAFAGPAFPCSTSEVEAWVVEVLSISQAHAAGAIEIPWITSEQVKA